MTQPQLAVVPNANVIAYERMRQEVANCARIDHARELYDKAAALAAYARQRDDKELAVWLAEIRLRAALRIGELSRELEKAQYHKGHGTVLPTVGKYKGDALASAGLSTSSAHRFEQLTGGDLLRRAKPDKETEERAISRGMVVGEKYFADCAANGVEATHDGLRAAVREGIAAEIGQVPPRPALSEDARGRLREMESQAARSWHAVLETMRAINALPGHELLFTERYRRFDHAIAPEADKATVWLEEFQRRFRNG